MTPFWSDASGGSHSRKMEVEEVTVPAGFVAGALGTRKKEKRKLVIQFCLVHLHKTACRHIIVASIIHSLGMHSPQLWAKWLSGKSI